MNPKLKELSYDTLYDIKDKLNHQIEKELKAVNLFNFNKHQLTILQNDRMLVGKALAQKNDEAFKRANQIRKNAIEDGTNWG